MKKITIISSLIALTAVVITSCGNKREPGRIYMPDMTYSRAYETYAERDSAKFTMDPAKKGGTLIYYDNKPVNGTIKQGELFPYPVAHDTILYRTTSGTVKNPYDSLSAADMAESGRLFNINCAICHGEKGGGNGPLSAKIGGIANLTLPDYVKMADGTMFYSITYGKNLMGSYASQLDRKQRWMIVKYIRTLQPKPAGATPASDSTGKAGVMAKADTTAKKA